MKMESVQMTLTENPNYYNISQNYPAHRNQQQLKNNNSTTKSMIKIQPIAPAPPTINDITNKNQQPMNSIRGLKKKYTYANLPYDGEQQQPQSVVRRNARERNRVKQVNNGFATLRQHIPQSVVSSLTNNGGRGASKKLSKVDTLRIAVEYISRLQELIRNNESDNESTSSSYHSAMSTISSSINSYEYYSDSTDMKQENNFSNRSPSYSEISTSPVPSCSSEQSICSSSNNQYYQMQPMVMTTPNLIQQQYKYNDIPYDHYNSSSITDTTPEDEELLDYISSWQEQQ